VKSAALTTGLTASTLTLSAVGKACHRRACPQAAIVAAYLPNAAGGDKLG